jgi:isopentenyl phosphate kinase
MIFNQLVLVLHGLKSYAPSVIYAGLTDGVLDSKNNTIPLITRKNFDSINTLLTGAKGYDVTGGMKTKVVSCLENSEYGVTSLIINGSEKGNIKQALLGKEIKGTIIR